jgi:thioredoxin-related protein
MRSHKCELPSRQPDARFWWKNCLPTERGEKERCSLVAFSLFLLFFVERMFRPPSPSQEDFSPFSMGNVGQHTKQKNEHLERLFRPPVEITFQGDFESACKAAEKANKLLLVNLQDQKEFGCQVLNRDTWSSEALKRFVSEHFIFWYRWFRLFLSLMFPFKSQPSVLSEFGRYYSQYYGVRETPHIAVLDPATKYREAYWEGVLSAVQLTERLRNLLRDRRSSVIEAAPAPVERSMSKAEQEALAKAIQESLHDDVVVEDAGVEEEVVVEDEMMLQDPRHELEDEDLAVAIAASLANEDFVESKRGRENEVEKPEEAKKRRTDVEPPEAEGEVDTTLRVRDATGVVKESSPCVLLFSRFSQVVSGLQKQVKLRGNDTVERLMWLVGRVCGVAPGSFVLSTMAPKIDLAALPQSSLVREHGLNGSTLVLQPKQT